MPSPFTNRPTTPLTFHWQSTIPVPTIYTVFIHLRASDGFVRSQADGPPVRLPALGPDGERLVEDAVIVAIGSRE